MPCLAMLREGVAATGPTCVTRDLARHQGTGHDETNRAVPGRIVELDEDVRRISARSRVRRRRDTEGTHHAHPEESDARGVFGANDDVGVPSTSRRRQVPALRQPVQDEVLSDRPRVQAHERRIAAPAKLRSE